MKIMVLMGSPNENGSSAHLAENFIRGAKEQGHTVKRIDAAHVNVSPCTGCIACGYEGPCAQKDDMEKIRPEILDADMLVFVTHFENITSNSSYNLHGNFTLIR